MTACLERKPAFLASAVLAAAIGTLGCPVTPRPVELDDLRLMADSPVAAEAAARAPEVVEHARDLQAQAESAWEAAYAEVDVRLRALEPRLTRLWAYRDDARERARERARLVEEEALRFERAEAPERDAWDREWRLRVRSDVADARTRLAQARMLGVETAYPEAARMASETIETAGAATDASPFRIERPLADYAVMQADEMHFRMASLAGDDGPEVYAQRVSDLLAEYRTGFSPPFIARLEPSAVVLTLEAKEAEIEVAFPGPVDRALRDLRTKWTANAGLLCLVAVRSLDPDCGERCSEKTADYARRFAETLGSADAPDRTRTLGLGSTPEATMPEGLSRAGALRIEVRLFPALETLPETTAGHTVGVAAGSQSAGRTFWFNSDSNVIPER